MIISKTKCNGGGTKLLGVDLINILRVLFRRWLAFVIGKSNYPVTPDGRYFVVREKLWRMTNPTLHPDLKTELVSELMDARRAVGVSVRANDKAAETEARRRVDLAKLALGERGPTWWLDGAPDYNRRMVKNTPYAEWYVTLSAP